MKYSALGVMMCAFFSYCNINKHFWNFLKCSFQFFGLPIKNKEHYTSLNYWTFINCLNRHSYIHLPLVKIIFEPDKHTITTLMMFPQKKINCITSVRWLIPITFCFVLRISLHFASRVRRRQEVPSGDLSNDNNEDAAYYTVADVVLFCFQQKRW